MLEGYKPAFPSSLRALTIPRDAVLVKTMAVSYTHRVMITGFCPNCRAQKELNLSWQPYSNDQGVHIRGECPTCHAWVRWVAKNASTIAMAGQPPRELKDYVARLLHGYELHRKAEVNGTLCGKRTTKGRSCGWDTSKEPCPWHE